MSAARILLGELRDRGVALRIVGDRLRFRPVAAVTPDLRERMASSKLELFALLECFEERAAILQFDAGFTREEAERRAWEAVLATAEVGP